MAPSWPGQCPRCGRDCLYSERFDATLCAWCDEWREMACPDPSCGFCGDRPPRPSIARELAPGDGALRRAARQAARRGASRRDRQRGD